MNIAKPVKLLAVMLAVLAMTVLTAGAADTQEEDGTTTLQVGTVTANSGLKYRSEPSFNAQVKYIVPKGAKVIIAELLEGGWGKTYYNGESGYMSMEYLDISESEEFELGSGRITGSVVNMRSGPSTDYEVYCKLSKDTTVEIIGIENSWFMVQNDQYTGYIHPDYIVPVSETIMSAEVILLSEESSDLRTQIVEYAKQFIGTRYTYGGRSPSSGFDCSGFVYYVFKNFGYTLNPGATSQMRVVTRISKGELLPGDLVFFNEGKSSGATHVGIYVGGNQFIHATKPGSSLTISSMSDGYYSRYYTASGRVFN